MVRLALLGAGLAAAPMHPLSAQEPDARLEERLPQIISERMAHDGVPGLVVTLLRDGAPVWTGAFGLADPQSGREMTPDAIFRVESISKPVTAWGAMWLVERGRLDLDAPVSDCLVRWRPPEGTPPITVRQLLSHDAGIGLGDYAARYAPGSPLPSLADHLAADFRLIAAPGTGFHYSDTGYNLLELVMEDCAGEEFGSFMEREVLRPLGMSAARYDWPDVSMPLGHDLRGRPVAPYVYPGRGSGGLFANAADIARFAAAGMDGAGQEVLSPDAVAWMHTPQVAVSGLFGVVADGYGLGHFTETLSDGRAAAWHGGQGYGWMSHMHLVPETGDGIVILSNSQRAWPLFAAILREWSLSLGVEPVGMSRVLRAETMARTVMALLLAVTVAAGYGAASGRAVRPAARTLAAIAGIPLIAWPLWVATQDYVFVFSILPGLWPWLAAASGVSGLALLTLAAVAHRAR